MSFSSRSFACGLSVESLTAQTCDENWSPKFVFREQGNIMAYKLVELQNMAAYLDAETEMFGGLDDNEAFIEKMSMKTKGNLATKEYILNPVTATATIKRNCSERPLNSRKTPRLACDLQLSNVEFDVTDRQYQCIVTGARTLHQLHKNRKYWKWRPEVKVKDHARLWWHYVITCHMEVIHERNKAASWRTVLTKARENVKYVEAFKKYLENPVVFDSELKEHKEDMDSTRSYEELKALREQAVLLLKKEREEPDEASKITPTSEESRSLVKDEDVDAGDNPNENPAPPPQSLLQRWFPLWGGWYGDPQEAPDDDDEEELDIFGDTHAGADKYNRSADQSTLEDEIMGALADEVTNLVPYTDVIFAQLSFTLKKGTTRLLSCSPSSPLTSTSTSKRRLLFEFEFTDTKVDCETRPRTKSHKLNLTLGAMYLRDKVTPDTVFPMLISPQFVVGAPLCPKKSSAHLNSGSVVGNLAKSIQNFLGSSSDPPTATEPLFYLLYEKRPFSSSKIDFRLHLKSQPLNVVYNPTMVQCVIDFFKIPEDLNRTAQLSQKIRDAAYTRIEEAKQKTKEELKRNIYSLFDETYTFSKKMWDISFDLSAPQILIPEHFIDKEALIMVLDLGKLHLENEGNSLVAAKRKQQEESMMSVKSSSSGLLFSLGGLTGVKTTDDADEDDGEDDEFVTPASSPTSPNVPEVPFAAASIPAVSDPVVAKSGHAPVPDLEDKMARKFYDRYTISLNDMQVIVGRVKDNWKHAHVKGTSSLHILDKFSIALHCERRIVATSDPNLPNIVVSGTLPKLNVHVNEDKVHSLERIATLLAGDLEADNLKEDMANKGMQTEGTDFILDDYVEDEDDQEEGLFSFQPWTEGSAKPDTDRADNKTVLDESSKLLLLYFCVSDMSVELQSMGKSIAELQVTGVKASFTKRPYDTNIAMSVHSLLLVDALQTFGPNFELLVASHRHVSVDSVSGSLRGSEPVSPRSPGSPDPGSGQMKPMSPLDITKALTSLQTQKRGLSPHVSQDIMSYVMSSEET